MKLIEFKEFWPTEENEQVHVNHTNCPAGEDRRQRLYMKRVGQRILGYCHNCGESACFISRNTEILKKAEISPHETSEKSFEKSKDYIKLPKDVTNVFPKHVKEWLIKYGITKQQVHKFGLCYSPGLNRLIIPVYDPSGNLIFWQGRGFAKGPKYYTKKVKQCNPIFYGNFRKGDVVVIVEDAISAIRVGEYTNSVCLFGKHLHESVLVTLSTSYNKVVVWLDADAINDAVILTNKIRPYFTEVKVIFEEEPKKQSRVKLREILYGDSK